MVWGLARGLTIVSPCPLGAVRRGLGANCERGASPPGGQHRPSRGSSWPASEGAASGAGARGQACPTGLVALPVAPVPSLDPCAPPCFAGRVS